MTYDHASVPIAELMQFFAVDHECPKIVGDLCRYARSDSLFLRTWVVYFCTFVAVKLADFHLPSLNKTAVAPKAFPLF
jgi:hypothetical protein